MDGPVSARPTAIRLGSRPGRLDSASARSDAGPPSRTVTTIGMLLIVALTVLSAVWEAFLVPLRIGGTVFPICLAAALLGNVALGIAGGRLLRLAGAAVPAALWFVVAGLLGTRRPEGDLIIIGSTVGTSLLGAGVLGSAVALVVVSGRRRRSVTSPDGRDATGT